MDCCAEATYFSGRKPSPLFILIEMVNREQFARYLLDQSPQSKAPSLALYHYVKNSADLKAPFQEQLIRDFLLNCLTFEHWRENRKDLIEKTHEVVGGFLRLHSLARFDNSLFEEFDQLQIIPVPNLKIRADVLRVHLESHLLPGEKLRILAEDERILLVLRLRASRDLTVTRFDENFRIEKGRLVPLVQDRSLHYDGQLELKTQVMQKISLSPFSTAQFTMGPDGAQGLILRGYTFQKAEGFNETRLIQIPKVFYALKGLERHFIHKESDPFYKELVMLLTQALDVLRQGHPEGAEIGLKAFERGQIALEHIFQDDKRITNLLEELAQLILREPQESAQEVCLPLKPMLSDSIDFLPSAELPAAEKPTNSSKLVKSQLMGKEFLNLE